MYTIVKSDNKAYIVRGDAEETKKTYYGAIDSEWDAESKAVNRLKELEEQGFDCTDL